MSRKKKTPVDFNPARFASIRTPLAKFVGYEAYRAAGGTITVADDGPFLGYNDPLEAPRTGAS